MVDGWRAYLQMASGLGEITASRAREVVQGLRDASPLLGSAPAAAGSLTAVAEDLLASARANRGLVVDVVNAEVHKSVAALGLATPADVALLRSRITELEQLVARLEQERAAASTATKPTVRKASTSTAKKSTAKKSTAKKSTAKKSTAKKSAATTARTSTAASARRSPSHETGATG